MALFDPVAVNRQIDSFLQGVPAGKRGLVVLNADLLSKKASAALVVKVRENLGAYARISKTLGGALEADAGARITFLVPQEQKLFSYFELVELLKSRGFGWVKAHLGAFKLLRGKDVAI